MRKTLKVDGYLYETVYNRRRMVCRCTRLSDGLATAVRMGLPPGRTDGRAVFEQWQERMEAVAENLFVRSDRRAGQGSR